MMESQETRDVFFVFDGLECDWTFDLDEACAKANDILNRMATVAAETGMWPEESEAVCWGVALQSVAGGKIEGTLELKDTPAQRESDELAFDALLMYQRLQMIINDHSDGKPLDVESIKRLIVSLEAMT